MNKTLNNVVVVSKIIKYSDSSVLEQITTYFNRNLNFYIILESEIIVSISRGQNKSKIRLGITIINTLDKFSILLQIIIENILNKDNILSPSKVGFSNGIWKSSQCQRESIFKHVMLCVIWYHLYNLENVKSTRGRALVLVKLQAPTSNFTKSITLP